MGCNLNQLSQCTNKCDCGNLNTLMFKDNENTEIEQKNANKLFKAKTYNDSKNIFQISRINENSQNIFQLNINENNNDIKKEKNKLKACINISKENNVENKEPKINFINNCMNNVTIECDEKNDENSSIYEDNKNSFEQMEDANNKFEIDKLDKLQCSNIDEKIDDIKEQNILNKNTNTNIVKDLIDEMDMANKITKKEYYIEFEGEKCIFQGNLKNEKNITGNGKIVLKDGSIYEGTFINGKLTGEGSYTNSKGDIYMGNFNDGILNGKGKIIKTKKNLKQSNGGYNYIIKQKDNNKNKVEYEGDIKNFKKEGEGFEKCSEYEYKGDFHEDVKSGKGFIIYLKTNIKYDGDFKNNERNGYGLLTYGNDQIYEGDVVNGRKEGKGTYKWPNGNEYKGEYKNDRKQGKGSYKMSNGIIFEGNFSRGIPYGNGKYIYNNREYNVNFKKGKINGDVNQIFTYLKYNPDSIISDEMDEN